MDLRSRREVQETQALSLRRFNSPLSYLRRRANQIGVVQSRGADEGESTPLSEEERTRFNYLITESNLTIEYFVKCYCYCFVNKGRGGKENEKKNGRGTKQKGRRENGEAGNMNYADFRKFMKTYLCVSYVAD